MRRRGTDQGSLAQRGDYGGGGDDLGSSMCGFGSTMPKQKNDDESPGAASDLEGGSSGYGASPRAPRTASAAATSLRMIVFLSIVGVLALSSLWTTGSVVICGVIVICGCAQLVAFYFMQWMLAQRSGNRDMMQIVRAIREGSEAYIRRVFGTIFVLMIPVAIAVFFLYTMRESPKSAKTSSTVIAFATTGAFIFGACCSALSGYIGLWTSIRANGRVAHAACTLSYVETIVVALRSGAIAGITVVSLAVAGIATLFSLMVAVVGQDVMRDDPVRIPVMLIGFGFGASFVALFAQLGGGIFTKAADVGADLVGKVENDIPEDDPRNPAVIADLVGDNVGDCSARGADLFESLSAEIIAAMILGAAVIESSTALSARQSLGFVLFPLVIHAADLIVSTIGVFSVGLLFQGSPASRRRGAAGLDSGNGGEEMNGKDLDDPVALLKNGFGVAVLCSSVTFALACKLMLDGGEKAPLAWRFFFLAGVVGMVSGYLSVLSTQFFTDYTHRPVISIAQSSMTGHATNVITGLAVGLESAFMPCLIIGFAVLSSYWLGRASGLVDLAGKPTGGLYGTAVATMGMLSTLVYILAMDVFGPIADNAGGIVEMSPSCPAHARVITDRLDAAGNTTKAATKGFAVCSAGLACFLLFRAFLDEVEDVVGIKVTSVDVTQPEVFIAGLFGAVVVMLFSSYAMSAVGLTAEEVVREVRRQFREMPGIMDYTQKPDYARCVEIVAKASLVRMVKPGLLAVLSPIAVGLLFRLTAPLAVGDNCEAARQLVPTALTAFVVFSTLTCILFALFFNNAGGAWDNAKKLVETGFGGGKNSSAHDASITGDTVGDRELVVSFFFLLLRSFSSFLSSQLSEN